MVKANKTCVFLFPWCLILASPVPCDGWLGLDPCHIVCRLNSWLCYKDVDQSLLIVFTITPANWAKNRDCIRVARLQISFLHLDDSFGGCVNFMVFRVLGKFKYPSRDKNVNDRSLRFMLNPSNAPNV